MSKILKYNDSDNINFEYGTINMINQYKKRFNIFYKHKNNYESIIIKTPKIKLVYKPDIESKLLTVSLEPIIGNNENLYNFIKKLDNDIELYIKKNLKKKVKYRSNITEDNKFFIKLPYKKEEQKFKIYNKNSEIASLSDLENNSIICIIEAVDCWIDLNKKLAGINWNLIQLKYYNDINNNICLIDSDEDNEPNVKKEVILLKCAFCNSISYISEQYATNYINQYNNNCLGKGKGKGKGPPARGKGNSGRGTIIKSNNNNSFKSSTNKNQSSPSTKSNTSKKPAQVICVPTADELIKIRNRLKKSTI